MTRRNGSGGLQQRLPLVLLAVAGVYLLVRGWDAVGAVTAVRAAGDAAVTAPPPSLLAEVHALDAALAAVEAPGRDPMHQKPRRAVRANPTPRNPEPEVTVPPRLRMILFDSVNPVIQISVAGQRSGNLNEGGSYQGWRVDKIFEDRAVVSKDTETFTIRRAP